jgi:endonuclease/exonuclease/phosphatase family metal-dependent hydrolase
MKLKSLLIKLERFFLYVNFFFSALLLLSYLAAVISPGKFWPLAFLGLIYLTLLYINLFFVVYWAVRLKKYFFISTLSILLGYNVLLNSIGFNVAHISQSSSTSDSLKLMTYNVHTFQGMDERPAYKRILKLIDLNQPGIIGFEEFYTQHSRFGICDSIKNVLHSNQFYFEPFKASEVDSTGLALFSKYPIIHRGIIRLSNEQNDNQGIYIDVKYQSQVVRIYCFHLKSLQLDLQDDYSLDKFSHRGVIGLSRLKEILKKLKAAFIIRGQQVNQIRQQVAMCPYPYVFMGDFNDTPGSYAFSKMSAGMKNAFREKGTGIGNTYKGGFASFQIDYILASRQFHIIDYQIIRKAISDHYPVCSTIGLN